MISTVISIYNPNEFLIRQLDSIRNQSEPVDEVILVDDASSNDAASIIESYIEKHHLNGWKLHRAEQNRGFVESFRTGLSLAHGDIIILCDQDDIWKMNKVAVIREAFEGNPDMLALATSFDKIDEQDILIPVRDQAGKSNHNLLKKEVASGSLSPVAFRDISIYNCSPGCTAAVSSSLRDQYLRWQGDLPHDWSLFAIAAMQNGLFYLDRVTTLYRQHTGNTYGLKHLSALEARTERAKKDLAQKKALCSLAEQFSENEKDLQSAREVCRFFERRLNYLKQRNVLQALALMADSRQYPFFYETIGADLKAILQSRKKHLDAGKDGSE